MKNLPKTVDEISVAPAAELLSQNLKLTQVNIDHFSSKVEQFSQCPFYSGATWWSARFAEVANHLETSSIFQWIPLSMTFRALDIGAGGGRWSLSLVNTVGAITAIEPSDAFESLSERLSGFKNVRCVHQSFEEFRDEEPYDLAIISGVLMYILEPDHLKSFLAKVVEMLKDSGYLVLREPIVARGERVKLGRVYKKSWSRSELEKYKYLEIVRPKTSYVSLCEGLGLRKVAQFASHAPVIKDPMLGIRILRDLYDRLNERFVSMDNIRYLRIAHRLLRKPYLWLGMLLNKQTMTIMIFQKRTVAGR